MELEIRHSLIEGIHINFVHKRDVYMKGVGIKDQVTTQPDMNLMGMQ